MAKLLNLCPTRGFDRRSRAHVAQGRSQWLSCKTVDNGVFCVCGEGVAGFMLPSGVVTGWPVPVFSALIAHWSRLRSFPEAHGQDSSSVGLELSLSLGF